MLKCLTTLSSHHFVCENVIRDSVEISLNGSVLLCCPSSRNWGVSSPQWGSGLAKMRLIPLVERLISFFLIFAADICHNVDEPSNCNTNSLNWLFHFKGKLSISPSCLVLPTEPVSIPCIYAPTFPSLTVTLYLHTELSYSPVFLSCCVP